MTKASKSSSKAVETTDPKSVAAVIPADGLDTLIKTLQRKGYRTVGPRARDGAIVLDDISSKADLPYGLVEEQEGGTYRLVKAKKPAYFDFTHGAAAWKRFLFPPKEQLWRANRTAKGFDVTETIEAPKYAFIGVRACDVAAIGIQDQVFMDGEHINTGYARRREQAFIVALNCRRAGGTCFCASMGTGPKAESGYDLALTELKDKNRHVFLVEVGSPAGEKVLAALDGTQEARKEDFKAAKKAVAKAAKSMGRVMPSDARGTLAANLTSAHWDEVAKRCLDCANCTMVCPTCFCNTTKDVTSLDGAEAQRWRQWDSCFTLDFSYIHGGAIRTTGAQRYRQWIGHKLTHWHDQFGVSGCVGCGRCITWCPVGIDITAEVRALAVGQG